MNCFKPVSRQALPDFVFGVFKAVGHKVDGLVLCDGVFLEAGLVGVEGQDLGLVRQTILQKKTHTEKKRLHLLQQTLSSTLNRKCGIAE